MDNAKDAALNHYIDHAVLKPQMTRDEADCAIRIGLEYNVRCICVRPWSLESALAMCEGADSAVGATLSFPHGTHLTASKADEARRYVSMGVDEIDMVVNYGLIRGGQWDSVEADISAVTDVTAPAGVVLKVILETSELDLDQITRATGIAVAAGADFVKTSTGFASGGATEEAVAAMLGAAKGRIGVKASGGIRTAEQVRRFIDMGCTRIGVGFATTPALCVAQPAADRQRDGTY